MINTTNTTGSFCHGTDQSMDFFFHGTAWHGKPAPNHSTARQQDFTGFHGDHGRLACDISRHYTEMPGKSRGGTVAVAELYIIYTKYIQRHSLYKASVSHRSMAKLRIRDFKAFHGTAKFRFKISRHSMDRMGEYVSRHGTARAQFA